MNNSKIIKKSKLNEKQTKLLNKIQTSKLYASEYDKWFGLFKGKGMDESGYIGNSIEEQESGYKENLPELEYCYFTKIPKKINPNTDKTEQLFNRVVEELPIKISKDAPGLTKNEKDYNTLEDLLIYKYNYINIENDLYVINGFLNKRNRKMYIANGKDIIENKNSLLNELGIDTPYSIKDSYIVFGEKNEDKIDRLRDIADIKYVNLKGLSVYLFIRIKELYTLLAYPEKLKTYLEDTSIGDITLELDDIVKKLGKDIQTGKDFIKSKEHLIEICKEVFTVMKKKIFK